MEVDVQVWFDQVCDIYLVVQLGLIIVFEYFIVIFVYLVFKQFDLFVGVDMNVQCMWGWYVIEEIEYKVVVFDIYWYVI